MADVLEPDLYAVLRVSPSSSREELRAAYRRLARRLHPDSRPDEGLATVRFRELAEAYETLSNPRSRAVYDAERANHEAALVRLEPDRVDVLLRAGRSVTRRVSVVGGMADLTAAVTAGSWWRIRMPATRADRTIEITLAAPPDASGELHATVQLRHGSGRLELPVRARVVRRRRVLQRAVS